MSIIYEKTKYSVITIETENDFLLVQAFGNPTYFFASHGEILGSYKFLSRSFIRLNIYDQKFARKMSI